MANVTAPRNGIPIGLVTINGVPLSVSVHPEYLRFFEGLLSRAGGVTGAGTDDLAASQFDDAGIEETKLAVYRVSDGAGQVPAFQQLIADNPQTPPPVSIAADDMQASGLEELRAKVAVLTKAVEALQQGLTA